MATLATLLVKLQADTSDYVTKMDAAAGIANRTGKNLDKAGSFMTKAVTAPLIAAGAASIKLAGDFDQAMRNVNSILLLTEEEFQQLKVDVTDFSLTTRSSAVDVANALLQVSAAGFRGEEALELMRYSASAAGAAFTTSEEMARLLIGAINSYGFEVSEAARLNDLFIYAMQKGAGSVGELSNELGTIFPTAASARVGIDEVVAGMTILVRGGLSTAEAATAMNQAILALLKPSEEMNRLLEESGYQSGVAAIESLGFAGVMQLVQDVTGGSAERLAELFPNIRGLRAAMMFASGGAEDLAAALDDVRENSEGAMDRARTEQYQSAWTQLLRIWRAVENLGLKIGNQILPQIADAADQALPRLREFVDGVTAEDIQRWLKWGLVLAAIGPTLKVLAVLAKGIGGVITVAKFVGPVFTSMSAAVTAGNAAYAAGLTRVTAFRVGLSALHGTAAATALTIGLVTAALIAVGIALYKAWELNKQVKTGLEETNDQWLNLLNTQVEAGASGMGVADVFLQKQGEVNKILDESNALVVAVMGGREKLLGNYDDLSNAVLKAARNYGDYRGALLKVAEANGYFVDSQGNLIEKISSHGVVYDRVISQNYLLSESQFENQQRALQMAEAVDVLNDSYQDYYQRMKQIEASEFDFDAMNTAKMIEKAEALEERMKRVDMILSTVGGRLRENGMDAGELDRMMSRLEVSMGKVSAEEVKLKSDLLLVTDAFSLGIHGAEQYEWFLRMAEEGTLDLGEAHRRSLSAIVEQTRAMRDAEQAAQDLAIKQMNLAEALMEADKAQVARAAIQELSRAYESGMISFEDYTGSVMGIQWTFGLVNEESVYLAEGLTALMGALEAGSLPAEMFDSALQGLIDNAREGKIPVDEFIESLLNAFEQMAELETEPPDFVQPMAGAFEDALDEIDFMLPDGVSRITGGIHKAVTSSFTEIGAALPDGGQEIVSGAEIIAGAVEEVFTTHPWDAIGYGIGEGVAAGLSASTPVVEAAARALAAALRAAIEAELDMGSPSKVMERLGENARTSFADAVRGDGFQVTQAAEMMVQEVVRPAEGAGGSGGGNSFVVQVPLTVYGGDPETVREAARDGAELGVRRAARAQGLI